MKKNMNMLVISGLIMAIAFFGCNNGNTGDATAAGALIDGAALYGSDCGGCHGSLAKSGKRGASVSQIENAIAHDWGGMGAFASLSSEQLQAIATALSDPATLTTSAATAATNTPTS